MIAGDLGHVPSEKQPARTLRVLLVEDQESDAALILHHLEQGGYSPAWTRVESEAAFVAALTPDLDVILADFNLPAFSAPRALELLEGHDVRVPLIVVSGTIGEETAVEVLRRGAADYLLKDRLARLGQAIQRVIGERQLQEQKRRAEAALEEAEARTRFALQAARVGVWEVDFQSGAVRWSETLEALHGMAPRSFGGTQDAYFGCVHPDDRDRVRASVVQAIRQRTDPAILYRTVWADGTQRWIRATGKTFYDETGAPLRAAGIGLDVTEQHLLEEQYRQSQKVEAIGQLAGGIAHDFNNLLTVIHGHCELLGLELGPGSPHQRDLGHIRRAAERAASLTRQLLAFSRRQILAPRVLDLRESVKDVRTLLARLIGEHIEVVLRVPAEAACVKADPSQIEQVLLNLALNARDAMPQGGSLTFELTDTVVDEMTARRQVPMQPGRYILLAVRDTGIGMDAATQARIFEPFFTTKAEGRGTGLGLSTVYGIVKQSGGYVWVSSQPGQGATFNVYLPRAGDAADQPPPAAAAADLSGSETVLVIEDEPGVRRLVEKILQRFGYDVLVASTPAEALAIARDHAGPIDLLITDVVLPQMSGRSVGDQIAAARPGIRVLYMSGYTDDAIVHHGVLDPDTPFLQKPFTGKEFAQKVRTVLGERHPA